MKKRNSRGQAKFAPSWKHVAALFSGFRTPVSPRALGLARILFGGVVFMSMAELVPHARDLYSDEGMLPRQVMLGVSRATRFSLMDMAGSPTLAALFLLAACAATLCFCIGWHTRIATVASFLLVSSVAERNLDVCDGHDNVVRIMLAIFMFVPMGARYSVDALVRRARGEPPEEVRWTLPVRLAQIQFAWIYLDTFVSKWSGDTWPSGTAVRAALSLVHGMARPWSAHLVNVRAFTVTMNWATLAFEAAFFFLVFSPVAGKTTRRIAILGGTMFHAGIFAMMNVGWFPQTMITLYAIYLDDEWATYPSRLWVRWAERSPAVASLSAWGMRWLESAQTPAEPIASPAPRPLASRWAKVARGAAGVALAALLVGGMWTTIPTVYAEPLGLTAPTFVSETVESLELWQNWEMFAPNPTPRDVWVVSRGKLRDGHDVDVFRGRRGAPLIPRPTPIYNRWAKYRDNLAGADRERLLELGRYLCREWNRDGTPSSAELVRFTITRFDQDAPDEAGRAAPVEKTELWSHECFDPPAAPADNAVSAL